MLAALAAVTERVEIGPLVASTSFHNPAMLAKKAATIDEISGGRLDPRASAPAGTARTTTPTASRTTIGSAASRRRSRSSAELLATGRSDFRGTYYALDRGELLPRGPRRTGPPLLVGSTGERMLAITLPHVAAWNAWGPSFGNSLAAYLPLREQVDDACRRAGRDPAEVERTLALVVAFPGALGRGSAVSEEPFEPIPGDAATLAPALRAFADAGVRHVQLVLDPITIDSIAALEPTLAALDG